MALYLLFITILLLLYNINIKMNIQELKHIPYTFILKLSADCQLYKTWFPVTCLHISSGLLMLYGSLVTQQAAFFLLNLRKRPVKEF